MKYLLTLIVMMVSISTAASTPKLPIASGQYTFRHQFSEQPGLPSIMLTAKINGRHIVLINETESKVFPKGILDEGTLMWHADSKQWIVGHDKSDRYLEDVGGCSDGPSVVDLKNRIYWTC